MARATSSKMLTILAVEDVGRAREFYTAVFGWRVREDAPVYVELDTGMDTGLALYHRDGFARNTGRDAQVSAAGTTTGTELYVYVEDLDAVMSRLVEAGAEQLAPPKPADWGDRVAYFLDSDRNVLAVAQG